MPVLLRSQLDRSHNSRVNLARRPSFLLKLPSQDGSCRHRDSTSNQSVANLSKRTVVSVIDFPDLDEPPEFRRKKGFRETVKLAYDRLHIKYLLPLAFMMVYMVIGAPIFLWLEGPEDTRRLTAQFNLYEHERTLLLKRLEEIYHDQASMKSQQRRLFLEEAVDHFHQQIDVSFSNQTDWSLSTALYFSGTVFTTIGYGDVACVTVWGRIMTVLYAIVGIPLMLITLNDLGKFLYKTINGMVKLAEDLPSLFSRLRKKRPVTLEDIERADTHGTPRVEFQLSLDGSDLVPIESTTDESPVIDEPGPPPRIPVTVAIGVTVGWIFFCAALFKLWEHDWTYAESCYFMFISLSTIGLGDVALRRRDLMVVCFVFVIIGLSLVSMCINVIQNALEDLYMKILMKLILEYQAKLDEGDNQVGASVGMIKMWGNNRAAKYFMPLLSKDTRMTAMAKVQDQAEAKGITIPPIFSDLDPDSGLPKIFSVPSDEPTSVFDEVILHAKNSVERLPTPPLPPPPPPPILYDHGVQTDNAVLSEKAEQTESAEMHDSGIDTDIRFADHLDTEVQCDGWVSLEAQTQTTLVETSDTEVMTFSTASSESGVQTESVTQKDQELQTHIAEYLECDSQTDILIYACQAVQTPVLEFTDQEMQTERRARLLAQSIDRRQSMDPSNLPSSWNEIEDSDESLDWNPVDGMHAEKQRKVKDLKMMFDKAHRKQPK